MSVSVELLHLGSIAFLPQAVALVTEVYGNALTDEPRVVDVVFLTVGQFDDFIFLVSHVQIGAPHEVLGHDGDGIERHFDTFVLRLTDVCHHGRIARE